MQGHDFFVGIDWGYELHQACLIDGQGETVAERKFEHGKGLNDLSRWLQEQMGDGLLAVAIETPHGPVVETMMERGLAVYSVNPGQLDRFRDRLSPSGARDDRRDARVLAISLRSDPHCFRKLKAHPAALAELRELNRIEIGLTENRGRLANQIRQALWRHYPQFIELDADLSKTWLAELRAKAPTPEKARRLRKHAVENLLKQHRIRRINASQVLKILKTPGFPVADGTVQAACASLEIAFQQLALINQQHREINRTIETVIERLCESAEDETGHSWQRDVNLLSSIPGIGHKILATLLSESPDAWQRRDLQALRCLCGIAPVTRQSGKSRLARRRLACNGLLRNASYHWANIAIRHDPASRDKHTALRDRGHSHARALRGVGDRLLPVAVKMLERQCEFDPQYRSYRQAA